MQAVCERAIAESEASSLEGLTVSVDAVDQIYVQEVIAGSCDMLEKIISLAENDTLRFAPVRVFLRITTSSVFLLKAMSIGVRNGQLRSALNILDRSVHALRCSVTDDLHLANSYAVLLEMHINRLRKGFLLSSKRVMNSRTATRRPSVDPVEPEEGANMTTDGLLSGNYASASNNAGPSDWDGLNMAFEGTSADNDWLSLPFDPTMAPFGPSGTSSFPVGLESNGLDFIWNLPT